MKCNRCVIFIIILFLLCGCYDYKEPDDMSFVVAIGIDKGEDEGLFNYTLQFARPTNISSQGGESQGGKETLSSISVEAPSLYSALNVANHLISKTFTLSHTKIIVISDELAKEGVKGIIDSVAKSSDLRPTVYVCVSTKDAKSYLESVKPVIEINPVKYYRLIFENANSSYIPKNDAGTVYFNLKSDSCQNTLPLVGKGEDKTTKVLINNNGFDYKMKEYYAGEIGIDKQNKSEVLGTAVFKGEKMVGKLSGIESEMLNIITGKFTNAYNVFEIQDSQESVTVRMEEIKKPKINVDIKNKKIYINLYLDANLVSVPGEFYIEKNHEEFEAQVSEYIKEYAKNLLEKSQNEFDADIFGFADYAKRRFLTYEEYKNYDFNKKYKDFEFVVNVDFSIRRTGLSMKTDKEEK